ncbi:hypothetical protein JOE11_003789 [Robbsia andropogonis]
MIVTNPAMMAFLLWKLVLVIAGIGSVLLFGTPPMGN